jgi:ribosomal protein L11 methyltransferase
MKFQPLWRASIATTPEAEDAVAEILGAALGRAAVSWCDAETRLSLVTAYCEDRPAVEVRKMIAAGLERIRTCGLKIGSGKMTIAKVRREDWAESWKRHFRPIEIGDALLVKPSWSKHRPRNNQAVVVLDPGLSFGTGQHPTTEFCLREIVSAVCNRRNRRSQSAATTKSFLDIGTGSGILAIAAAMLGCRPVHAFDFDAEAIRVARANARANRIQTKLKIGSGDVAKLPLRPAQKYDLICANLISDLLIAGRRRIAAQLNPGGILVLAGILKSEFHQVQSAFEKLGLHLVRSRSRKEWRSGSFRCAPK